MLTGQSLQGYLTLSYPGHALGNNTVTWGAYVGDTDGPSTFTLTNSGNTTASAVSLAIPTAWYISSNTCGATLAVGASCTFNMNFRPSAVQVYDGFLVVSSSNSASAGAYSLKGIGVQR